MCLLCARYLCAWHTVACKRDILMRGINQKGVQSLHLIALRVMESKDGPAVSCAWVLWGWLLDKWGVV